MAASSQLDVLVTEMCAIGNWAASSASVSARRDGVDVAVTLPSIVARHCTLARCCTLPRERHAYRRRSQRGEKIVQRCANPREMERARLSGDADADPRDGRRRPFLLRNDGFFGDHGAPAYVDGWRKTCYNEVWVVRQKVSAHGETRGAVTNSLT